MREIIMRGFDKSEFEGRVEKKLSFLNLTLYFCQEKQKMDSKAKNIGKKCQKMTKKFKKFA